MQGGRADSIYSNLYFEFKKPNKFRTKKGISEALDGRDEKDRGLKHYLVNFTIDDSQNTDNDYFKDLLKNRVGVGFDGSKFIFARYKDSSNALNIFNKNKTNKFPSYINKSQKLSFDYDLTILGGLIVQVGSIMIDNSIKSKLQQIENNMIVA